MKPKTRTMRRIDLSRAYRNDHKTLLRSGRYDIDRLHEVVHMLASDMPLPAGLKDHELRGAWKGFRECHISFDWILIYAKEDDVLYLSRTGTHSELFKK